MRFVCFVLFFKIWYYYGFKCISHCALRWNFYYNQENFLHLFFIVHMWKLPLLCTMSFSVSSLIQHFFNSDLWLGVSPPAGQAGFSSGQFTCSVTSDSLQPHVPQHDRPPCPSPTPGVYSILCPLSRWCHPTIMLSPSPPAFNLSQHQGLFQWVSSSHQVAKVLEFQLQHQSFQWIFRTDLL